MAIPTPADYAAKRGAAKTDATPLTQDEASLKRAQDYQARLIAAETTTNPLAAQKLAMAQKRLESVQRQRGAFEVQNPEYSEAYRQAEEARKKSNKTMMIGAGVLGILGVSYFAWRKWRR